MKDNPPLTATEILSRRFRAYRCRRAAEAAMRKSLDEMLAQLFTRMMAKQVQDKPKK